MAIEWWQVPPEVTEMAEELIQEYHPSLLDARIAILFRSEAPVTNGKATLGMASKVNDKWRPLLEDREMHFVIWLAYDRWEDMDKRQKRALLDHELCHCFIDHDGKPQIHPHDFEEFAVVIARHGFWNADLERLDRTIQGKLPLEMGRTGYVTTIGKLAKEPEFVEAMDEVIGEGNWSVTAGGIPDVPEV